MSEWKPRRIAILGASGLTGSGLAHQLAQADISDEVVLFDLKRNVLEAHAIDMREAQLVTEHASTVISLGDLDDVSATGTVDLVVVAASLPEVPGGTRAAFLDGNLGVLRALIPAISTLAGDRGLVMMLTNPADVLATCLSELSSIAPGRIFGYCLNDSVRFAAAVGRELGVSGTEVEALVFGEHGDGQVPLYSRLRVSGQTFTPTGDQRARIDADVKGWFARWSELKPGRSSGWTTPVGARETIERLAAGIPVPVALWTGEVESLNDAHITMLGIAGEHSVGVFEVEIDTEEANAVARSVASIRAQVDEVLKMCDE
ncbi:malate dehydrogenase [Microbacterium foliorum]|uniref:Malate dehydrogenase n=1 Tax=Microbacterium foliorum TaxID=104336 RepID=A0ABU1HVJ4_9MICO|nr:hypothetical protein [Microbacterium foliorum]MDR6144073.1 malate dehydrogenase [Microbacterium foliorum]